MFGVGWDIHSKIENPKLVHNQQKESVSLFSNKLWGPFSIRAPFSIGGNGGKWPMDLVEEYLELGKQVSLLQIKTEHIHTLPWIYSHPVLDRIWHFQKSLLK